MPASLAEIIESTRQLLAKREAIRPLSELQALLPNLPATLGFAKSLSSSKRNPAVIAEIKKASPSGGLLRPEFDPASIARTYEASGAACLSVLTEEDHFQGNLERLRLVRDVVGLPLLQKDFIVSPYQVYEARVSGADAMLLIAAILDDEQLRSLAHLAASLDLDVLLEVHDEAELERALKVPTPMLGINNRSLKTYQIDLGTTDALIRLLSGRQGDRLIVSESGLRTPEDVQRVREAGAHAVLVGETLMRQPDLAAAFTALFGA